MYEYDIIGPARREALVRQANELSARGWELHSIAVVRPAGRHHGDAVADLFYGEIRRETGALKAVA